LANRKLIIIGAGGYARDVRHLAADITDSVPDGDGYEFVGFVISDLQQTSPYDSTGDVVGDFGWLNSHPDAFDCLAVGIGNASTRLKVVDELDPLYGPEFWPTLMHPSANFDRGSAQVGYGVQIAQQVAGSVNLVIDNFAMVSAGCTLGHEAVLGRACALNPGANISGGVNVGKGALIGTGAQILQYIKLEDESVVGAGAVVTKDVGAGLIVIGVPATVQSRK